MLRITFLAAALASFLGLVAAQNSTSLDPNSVDLTTRNQWCNGERNSCPILCGGPTFVAPNGNTCNGANLQYVCKCSNGQPPADIDQYLDTLPNYVCQETFKQCNIANPGSSACKSCGTKNVKDVPASSTTMAAASSTAAASTAAGTAASASAKPTGGAMGVGMGMGGGWGVLAGGALAGVVLL